MSEKEYWTYFKEKNNTREWNRYALNIEYINHCVLILFILKIILLIY